MHAAPCVTPANPAGDRWSAKSRLDDNTLLGMTAFRYAHHRFFAAALVPTSPVFGYRFALLP
jgi:hypothetical protein